MTPIYAAIMILATLCGIQAPFLFG